VNRGGSAAAAAGMASEALATEASATEAEAEAAEAEAEATERWSGMGVKSLQGDQQTVVSDRGRALAGHCCWRCGPLSACGSTAPGV
jgi:hypothetical protein